MSIKSPAFNSLSAREEIGLVQRISKKIENV